MIAASTIPQTTMEVGLNEEKAQVGTSNDATYQKSTYYRYDKYKEIMEAWSPSYIIPFNEYTENGKTVGLSAQGTAGQQIQEEIRASAANLQESDFVLISVGDLSIRPGFRSISNPSNSTDSQQQGQANIEAILATNPQQTYMSKEGAETIIDMTASLNINKINENPALNETEKREAIALVNSGAQQAKKDLANGAAPVEAVAPVIFRQQQSRVNVISFVESNSQEVNPDRYVEQPPKSYLSRDSMSSRRPQGDFFMVELVSSIGGGAVRVPVKTYNTEITSLKLMTSPNSVVINGSKKVNRSQTLTRWLEEHWGDEMDQISFTGSTFAFMDFRRENGGLCVDSRTMTAPYMELKDLVDLYKINGCVYQDEYDTTVEPRTFFNYADPQNPRVSARHPRSGMVKERVYVRLRCDFMEAIGYFESFDVSESSTNPYNMTYSVSFRSEFTRWL